MSTRSSLFGVEITNVKGAYDTYTIGASAIDYAYIIEDIMSFCIVGKMRFRDAVGIKEFGALTGEERIKITFGNSDQGEHKTYRSIEMRIYSIDNIDSNSPTQHHTGDTIELTFVDEYYFKLHRNYISKSWSDAYVHDIVADIMKNYVGVDVSDFETFTKTREKITHFDSNNRTPAECLSWLMARCSDTINGSPAFLLYRSGSSTDFSFKFNFVPMEKLLSQTDKQLMEPEGEKFIYTLKASNADYVNYVMEYEQKPVDRNALTSLIGGTVTGYDIMRKKLIKRTYTYKDGLKRMTVLGRYSIFPKDVVDNIPRPIIKMDGYSSEDVLDNVWYSGWIKEYCMQNLVLITVRGHEKRFAGGMIKIDWPSVDLKEKANKQLGGKYLVKSITNYFSGVDNSPWLQRVVLIKNGFRDSNNLELIEAVKSNG